MIGTTQKQPATAQSLGPLLKCARDVMRKDKGLTGHFDRLLALVSRPMSRPFRAGVNYLVTVTWGFARRFTPGYHMMGFQPSHCAPSGCRPFNC